MAIHEADIIAVMDGRAGSLIDAELAALLARSPKPVFLAVNKIEIPKNRSPSLAVYQLGWGDHFPISAREEGKDEHRVRFSLLLCLVLPDELGTVWRAQRIASSSRPNVGKSTLVNAILKRRVVPSSDIFRDD